LRAVTLQSKKEGLVDGNGGLS